jgi:hypothetical protein
MQHFADSLHKGNSLIGLVISFLNFENFNPNLTHTTDRFLECILFLPTAEFWPDDCWIVVVCLCYRVSSDRHVEFIALKNNIVFGELLILRANICGVCGLSTSPYRRISSYRYDRSTSQSGYC